MMNNLQQHECYNFCIIYILGMVNHSLYVGDAHESNNLKGEIFYQNKSRKEIQKCI